MRFGFPSLNGMGTKDLLWKGLMNKTVNLKQWLCNQILRQIVATFAAIRFSDVN